MKKVVDDELGTIPMSSLCDNDLIGVELNNGWRGHVMKVKPYMYVLSAIEENTYTNKIEGTTIQELLGALKRYAPVAYFFDNERELGNWLIEKL